MEQKFAFCETRYATGTNPWHIRQLTDQGLKLSGSADTKALCGRKVAWDLAVDITPHHLSNCCPKCARALRDSLTTNSEPPV